MQCHVGQGQDERPQMVLLLSLPWGGPLGDPPRAHPFSLPVRNGRDPLRSGPGCVGSNIVMRFKGRFWAWLGNDMVRLGPRQHGGCVTPPLFHVVGWGHQDNETPVGLDMISQVVLSCQNVAASHV